MPITKIVSGGQTGADRGGLEAALYAQVPHGGWCPKGRRSEDGTIPIKYRLQETDSREYQARTEANVVDSDATLIFTYGEPTGGTKLTFDLVLKHNKPHHLANLKGTDRRQITQHIVRWLQGEVEEEEFPPPPKTCVLNVAGPRESKVQGMEQAVMAIMVDVLRQVNQGCKSLYPVGSAVSLA